MKKPLKKPKGHAHDELDTGMQFRHIYEIWLKQSQKDAGEWLAIHMGKMTYRLGQLEKQVKRLTRKKP